MVHAPSELQPPEIVATIKTGDKSRKSDTTSEGVAHYVATVRNCMVNNAESGRTLGAIFERKKMEAFPRITFDPSVMGGKACIRGLRVTAGTVVGLLAAGRSTEEILAAYPYLEREDIDQSLAYAAWRLEEREVPLSLQ